MWMRLIYPPMQMEVHFNMFLVLDIIWKLIMHVSVFRLLYHFAPQLDAYNYAQQRKESIQTFKPCEIPIFA